MRRSVQGGAPWVLSQLLFVMQKTLSHRYNRCSVMNAESILKCLSRIKDTHWNSIPKWSVAVITAGSIHSVSLGSYPFSPLLCGCCFIDFSGCHWKVCWRWKSSSGWVGMICLLEREAFSLSKKILVNWTWIVSSAAIFNYWVLAIYNLKCCLSCETILACAHIRVSRVLVSLRAFSLSVRLNDTRINEFRQINQQLSNTFVYVLSSIQFLRNEIWWSTEILRYHWNDYRL